MSQFTKKAIIQTFLQLLNKQSMDKITVKDIVETCGINRNTFYYYYKDIYDLIDDIFKLESERIISEKNQFATWTEELSSIVQIAMNNKKAIAHIYYSRSRDVLEQYLFTMTGMIIRNYVAEHVDTTDVTPENVEFVCSFFCYSLVGLTLNWIKGGMQDDSTDVIAIEANIFENTIHGAIESCRTGKK